MIYQGLKRRNKKTEYVSKPLFMVSRRYCIPCALREGDGLEKAIEKKREGFVCLHKYTATKGRQGNSVLAWRKARTLFNTYCPFYAEAPLFFHDSSCCVYRVVYIGIYIKFYTCIN